ncbi:MAG: RsmB/NOP family class I SAM-dependent RNA methyltransferase [Deltaproteobacteria bacterium]|jgi:16S rRNA (cytosine1407-C5)-methyltransferase|nr:RsmB/NOP family class I SAM-dependent RNA methyltransferase [Deltaproteobacteria bacterium]
MRNATRVFRLGGRAEQWPLLEDLLRSQGYVFTELPFYSGARLLTREPLPLGASLAARFGLIYIQDASSMLPALALARKLSEPEKTRPGAEPSTSFPPARGATVLDLCASPGGKSALLARLLGDNSLILSNEPSPGRLATLRRNLELLNIFNAATLGLDGKGISPPAGFAGFDAILLDPPCSGWGTAEKHPRVLSLWRGDKVKPLIGLQRMLLRTAFRLLQPGGVLSYSTCTVNILENEEQIRWALAELSSEAGGFFPELLPLEPFPGFCLEPVPDSFPDCAGTLRIARRSGLAQGFYLALLRKAPTENPARRPSPSSSSPPGASGELPLRSIASPLLEPGLLPPGSLVFRQSGRRAGERAGLYFQHALGGELFPESFPRRDFLLGRGGGEDPASFQPDPGLHGLMPGPEEARKRGAELLQAEEPAPILALCSGQSLRLETKGREVGLYYKDLPLRRLKSRGGRVLL